MLKQKKQELEEKLKTKSEILRKTQMELEDKVFLSTFLISLTENKEDERDAFPNSVIALLYSSHQKMMTFFMSYTKMP